MSDNLAYLNIEVKDFSSDHAHQDQRQQNEEMEQENNNLKFGEDQIDLNQLYDVEQSIKNCEIKKWKKQLIQAIVQKLLKEPIKIKTFDDQFSLFKNYISEIANQLYKHDCRIEQYIGHGGEALIYTGKFKNHNDKLQDCVFRICQFKNEKGHIDIKQEFYNVQQIQKPRNIVKYYKFIDLKEYNICIIVMEKYAQSLFQKFKEYQKNAIEFEIIDLIKMIFDLIHGIIEIREHNLIHFDIKPGNTLVDMDGNLYYSDFGLSEKLSKDNIDGVSPRGKTPQYSAIEQRTFQKINHYFSDIYSLGITFNKLLQIFKQNRKSCKNINSNQSYDQFIEDFENFIQIKMTKESHTERITCLNLLGDFIQLLNNLPLIEIQEILEQQLKKIYEIISMYKYSVDKDIEYFQDVNFQFSLIHLQINLLINSIHLNFDEIQKIIELDQFNELFKSNKTNGNTSQSLYLVGLSYYYLGKLQFSLKCFLEVIKIQNSLQEYDFEVNSYSNLMAGHCYGDLNQANKSTEYYKKMDQIVLNQIKINIQKKQNDNIVQIQDQQIEQDNQNKIISSQKKLIEAKILNNIGANLNDKQQLISSHKYYQNALQIYKDLGITKNLELAKCKNNIATLLDDAGQHIEALKFYLESLDIKRAFNLQFDPDYANTLNNLGCCYFDLKEYRIAKNYQEEAIEILLTIYPKKNHQKLSIYLNNLASCCQSLQEQDKAIQYFEQSKCMKEQLNLDKTPEYAEVLKNMSELYFDNGQKQKGFEYAYQSIDILRNNQNSYQKLYEFLNTIGNMHLIQGQIEEAVQYLIESEQELQKNQILKLLDNSINQEQLDRCILKLKDIQQQKTVDLLNQYLVILSKENNRLDMLIAADIQLKIAKYYQNNKVYELAFDYFKKSLNNYKKFPEDEFQNEQFVNICIESLLDCCKHLYNPEYQEQKKQIEIEKIEYKKMIEKNL